MANIFQDIQQALVGGFSGEVSTNPTPVKKNAKPVDVIYSDPNALINEIVNKANQTDPTATNTVFSQEQIIIVLSNHGVFIMALHNSSSFHVLAS